MAPFVATSLTAAVPPSVRLPAAAALDLAGEDLSPLVEARLRELEPVLAAVHAVRVPVDAVFALMAGAIVIGALLLAQRGRVKRSGAWRLALLAVLAFPAASSLAFVLFPPPGTPGAVVAVTLAATALLWAAAALTARLGGPRRALAAMLLGTAAVMLVDQWLGAPMSMGVLGYSPLDGARFYGMGNEGAAILFGSALFGCALTIDARPEDLLKRRLAPACMPLLGTVAVVTAAAPRLGANVTVALWGTVGFAVAAIGASGRRIGRREIALAVAAAVVAVAAIAVADLSDAGGGTHLAAALRALGSGGVAAIVPLAASKIAMNLRILTATPGSLVVIAAMGWLAWAVRRPGPWLRTVLDERPATRWALIASLAGGALAMVTEDSGIVIPALILLYAGGTLGYLAMLRPPSLAEEVAS